MNARELFAELSKRESLWNDPVLKLGVTVEDEDTLVLEVRAERDGRWMEKGFVLALVSHLYCPVDVALDQIGRLKAAVRAALESSR